MYIEATRLVVALLPVSRCVCVARVWVSCARLCLWSGAKRQRRRRRQQRQQMPPDVLNDRADDHHRHHHHQRRVRHFLCVVFYTHECSINLRRQRIANVQTRAAAAAATAHTFARMAAGPGPFGTQHNANAHSQVRVFHTNPKSECHVTYTTRVCRHVYIEHIVLSRASLSNEAYRYPLKRVL